MSSAPKEVKSPKSMMGTLASKFNDYEQSQNYFPTDNIDPKLKDQNWCLAWQKAIWALYLVDGCYASVADFDYHQLLRMYGAGMQPNGIYMDLLLDIQQNGINAERAGYLSTNWEIFSPAPKLHAEIRGRFEKQEYDYVATAIDPTSMSEKEQKKWEIWYNTKYGKFEDEVMNMLGAPKDDSEKMSEYVAQSLEELEIFQDLGGLKIKLEQDSEKILDITDYLSDIKTVKQKFIDDLVDFGKAAFRDFYDPVTGLTKYEYMDWNNILLDYSYETDFKDIRFWSYVKLETINNIRLQAPDIPESELLKAAMVSAGYWGNFSKDRLDSYRQSSYKINDNVRVYDNFRVPLLISEWVSTDTEYRLVKKTKTGNAYFEQDWGKEYNTDKKKTKKTTVNNIYESTWVMGTEWVYNWGKSLNSARPDRKNPKLSIHAISIPGKSMIERIKPLLDQIELNWLKLQSALAMAAPNGHDIDISALEGISLDGENDLSVIELIKLKRQTGDTLRRTTDLVSGKYANLGKPINKNEGGVGGLLNEILLVMDVSFKYIYELTGIDLISAASSQRSDVTATQVKYAAAATSDALQPIFTSWVQAKENAAQSAITKIQRAIKYHPEAYEAYKGMVGESVCESLKIAAEKDLSEFGIKLEVRSSNELKQAAIQAATEALKPGKDGENINLPDWYFFVSMIERGRAKQAMAILNYRLNKSRQQSIQLQQENMQLNGQNAMQLQQQKDMAKAAEIQLQGQVDMKEEALKAFIQSQLQDEAMIAELKKQILTELLMAGQAQMAATQQAMQPQPTEQQPTMM
jgi:hypothetical protein